MNIKRYISAAIGLAAITSLAMAVPAFAQGNDSGQGQDNGQKVGAYARVPGAPGAPGMMNRGNGKGGPMMGRSGVVGTVSSVNGNTITLSGHQGFATTTPAVIFTVDATNAKVMKNNATSTVSSIAVGDMLFVQGTVSGTSVTATSIFDGVGARGWGMPGNKPGDNKDGAKNPHATSTNPLIQGNGQPIVAGTVVSVSGSTMVISNKGSVQYTVDTTNSKIVRGETAILLSSIQAGDSVIVQGTVNGTSIIASSVIDSAKPATPQENNGMHLGFFGGIGNFFKSLFGF